MYLLFIGVIALLLKYFEISPVVAWSWWIVLSPFAMAIVWWSFADSSGYTKRREMDKMAKRKEDRIERQREAMGMLSAKRKKK